MQFLRNNTVFFVLLIVVAASFFFLLRTPQRQQEVVVYVSHDQDYAQPVLDAFEQETGIMVKAIYDTEASKTVGLTNRLIAEKGNPQADVFWNNEVVRTIQLKKEDVLAVYKPTNYDKLAQFYKDPDGYWTGFAARARVLIVNTNRLNGNAMPNSLDDLTGAVFTDHLTIADPRFGTTGSHVAALYSLWGKDKTETYFQTLRKNKLDVAQSNGQTRDKVVNGEEWIGFTDTDDVNDALVKKQPVAMVYPDQSDGQIGTLVIPNTAMLIRGAKHPENGKKLLDYLISEKTESRLAFAKSAQMPLLPDVKRPETVPAVASIKTMAVSWESVYENLTPALAFIEKTLFE